MKLEHNQVRTLVFNLLLKPVILRQEMMHATMVFWVLPNTDSRLIVKPERCRTRRRVAQFRNKIPKPDTIRASFIHCNILCFSSRLSYNRLSLRTPVHQALANKHGMATSRACRVNIPIVCIRIDLQTCAILPRTIA